MTSWNALNFKKWAEENKAALKPPVGNKVVFQGDDFIIMAVGGPNSRKDFHFNHGEEFFYQVQGDIVVRIMDGDKRVDIPIREGDVYLLPPDVPHSPQRGPNTVGIVVERIRKPNELDAFQWYCESCGTKLYEESVHVSNIVTQLPPLFQRFYSDKSKCTCKRCGAVMEPPPPLA